MYLCISFLKLIFSSNIFAPTWVFLSSNIPLSSIFQSWKLFYFQVYFFQYFLQSLFHFRVFVHRKHLLSLVYFPSSIFFLHSFYSFTFFTLEIMYPIKCFPFREFILSECLPWKLFISFREFSLLIISPADFPSQILVRFRIFPHIGYLWVLSNLFIYIKRI